MGIHSPHSHTHIHTNMPNTDDLVSQLENLEISKTTQSTPSFVHNRLESIDDVVLHLKHCKNIVTVTGAGISTSCGIPDFRSDGGLYATIRQRFPDMNDPT